MSQTTFPDVLKQGMMMTKVSEKRTKDCLFTLDPDDSTIRWKSHKHGIIPIESIKELRVRGDAYYDRELLKKGPEYEDRWITIVYILNGEYRSLHLVAPTADGFVTWHDSLRKLIEVRQGIMNDSTSGDSQARENAWERKYWRAADSDGDEKITFKEVQSLCHRLNANCPEADLRRLFMQCNPDQQQQLGFDGYKKLVQLLKRRPDVERLHAAICSGSESGELDLAAFGAFLKHSQHSSSSSEEIEALFKHHSAGNPRISCDQFGSYLTSNDNSAFSDHHGETWQDMTRPMSEYYISSSHNTYLVGHQLMGVSTIEGYIRALLHSCRSVEMDIYDGDDDYDFEPVVYHGKTLTSKVKLRDICKAIAKYSFVSSPYPVIISGEVHCGIEQQDKLVAIMSEVFGESLVKAPIEGRPKLSVLPSPESLKHKFLLKAKNLVVVAKAAADKEAAEKAEAMAMQADSDTTTSSSNDNMMDTIKSKFRRVKAHVRSKSKSKPKPLMSFQLTSLLVYTVGVKCRGLSQKDGEYAPEHIFSLSESAANRMFKDASGMTALIQHNRTHVSRIYPKGTRVNSTNYEPHRYWASGAQLVAINWQTFDMGYMINLAMFKRNGHAGFILKPEALREPDSELLKRHTYHFFDVTVVSAQQLPRPRDKTGHEIVDSTIVDPFVEVTLYVPDWSHSPFLAHQVDNDKPGEKPTYSPAHGANPAQATTARTISSRTRVIKDNGFNPIWQEEMALPFDLVGDMKDLVFVKFTVWQQHRDDEDDEPLAVYCTSLASLNLGYRHLPLHDSQMTPHLFSTLFVKVGIRDANEQ